MNTQKPLLVFDITEKKFKNYEEFSALAEGYPNLSVLFVTPNQKMTVLGFINGSNRYIDASGVPLYSSKDMLACDTDNKTFIVATVTDLENLGSISI